MTDLPYKTYILDTSVLLSDPSAFAAFNEHNVVIPLVVIKELEGKRNDPVLGFNARKALRFLEKLRTTPGADLRAGVEVNPDGGTVRIEINHVNASRLPEAIRADQSNDTRILSVAEGLKKDGCDVIIVSKDLPLRLLADGALGIPAEEYLREQAGTSGQRHTGLVTVACSKEDVDTMYAEGTIDLETADIPMNSGVILKSPVSSALGVITGGGLKLVKRDTEIFGLRGRSAEQRIAFAHLLNPDIGIVSLGGPAGTGKSVLALAAALELVLEESAHKRIIVFRPVMAVGGQELGFLPGSEEEKMSPWAAAVFDALRAFVSDNVINEVRSRGLLEILPLTHIRGRTFTDSIIIVDEAQNLERGTILTAITRLGKNSRVVLLHDVAQRDSLHVGRYDGIAAVVERLKGERLFAHVTLTRSERSPVAALAAKLLDDDTAWHLNN
jgi:PhoH-like ATPase